jgi:hypothetical protein
MNEELLYRIAIGGAVVSSIAFLFGLGFGYLVGRMSERAAIAKTTGTRP